MLLGLLEPIERLREFIDMVRVLTIFKARRLLNIDLLLDWSIEDVCPKEPEEPPQAQDQPSSSTQASPPTQNKDEAQVDEGEDQRDEPPQDDDNCDTRFAKKRSWGLFFLFFSSSGCCFGDLGFCGKHSQLGQ